MHLLVDPILKLVPVDGRQLRQVGPQSLRLADVNVLDGRLRLVGVPVQQHANAPPQRSRHVDLVAADERHVEPAQLPGGGAGNSASTSTVVVNQMLATSAGSMPLVLTSGASSLRVSRRISSRVLASTVVAPRTPRQGMASQRLKPGKEGRRRVLLSSPGRWPQAEVASREIRPEKHVFWPRRQRGSDLAGSLANAGFAGEVGTPPAKGASTSASAATVATHLLPRFGESCETRIVERGLLHSSASIVRGEGVREPSAGSATKAADGRQALAQGPSFFTHWNKERQMKRQLSRGTRRSGSESSGWRPNSFWPAASW